MDLAAFRAGLWPDNWRELNNEEKKEHLENQIERVIEAMEDGIFQPSELALDTLRRAVSEVTAGLYWAAAWALDTAVHPDLRHNHWPNPKTKPSDLHLLTPESFREALDHLRSEPARDLPVFNWVT